MFERALASRGKQPYFGCRSLHWPPDDRSPCDPRTASNCAFPSSSTLREHAWPIFGACKFTYNECIQPTLLEFVPRRLPTVVRSASTSGIRVSQIPPPLLSYRRRRPTPGLLGYGQPLQLVHDAPHSILTHRSTTPGRYPARGAIALRVHSACPVHAKSVKKPSQAL